MGLLSNQGGLGWGGCAGSAQLSQYPQTTHKLHTLYGESQKPCINVTVDNLMDLCSRPQFFTR